MNCSWHPCGYQVLCAGSSELLREAYLECSPEALRWLFDLIEKNIIMAGDPIVLRAALLFTVQAAWSGDKWQMDIAMGQRGMYFSMLRHSGILEARQMSTPQNGGGVSTEVLWREWLQQEARSR